MSPFFPRKKKIVFEVLTPQLSEKRLRQRLCREKHIEAGWLGAALNTGDAVLPKPDIWRHTQSGQHAGFRLLGLGDLLLSDLSREWDCVNSPRKPLELCLGKTKSGKQSHGQEWGVLQLVGEFTSGVGVAGQEQGMVAAS